MADKVNVVLLQLGSPKTPNVSDVREYLREFLGDPRVVDINPTVWKIILNLFVLPFRPKRSARAYSRIWNGKGFPLVDITEELRDRVEENIGSKNLFVKTAYLLSSPRANELVDDWENMVKDFAPNDEGRWLFLPLFPQFSESTTMSVIDGLGKELGGRVNMPSFEFIANHHKAKCFIDHSVRLIEEHLEKQNSEGKPAEELILSFHGLPKRRVIEKKDNYYLHCWETFYLIRERLKGIDKNHVHLTFQSRFGNDEWLTPDTEEYAVDLAKSGVKNIAVYCPAFLVDCLETTDEIGTELGEAVHEAGGNATQVTCLNADPVWAKAFSEFLHSLAYDSRRDRENQFHDVPDDVYQDMPIQTYENPPIDKEAKSTLGIVFLTLFLDLVGFSIIFPLFPALAKHYLLVDGDNYWLNLIFNSVTNITAAGGVSNKVSAIVLFGGALGALYSLLQFIAAPLWGAISDRVGRKPVLLVSVFGLAISYLLWFFSGSFTLLIFARLIGGIMGGNISTATAVVADVTTAKNRSRGMATIGIAFAFGFIIGPAMGGIFSLVRLDEMYPVLVSYGVNPFSVPALIAFLLSAFNLVWIAKRFKETLPEESRGKGELNRTVNPIKLFKPLPYTGVNLVNVGHFLFLFAFSGMEFTLTFLAMERLEYSSLDNAYMFIFIGFIIALVQGGYVRRKAAIVGEKRMAVNGLVTTLPGLVIIAYATNSFMLYLGLFFLAVGSSMTIPTLTSLVSLYTPANEQGRSIGIFRSLGALARVVGPLTAAIIYWRVGGEAPYLYGSAFLLIPIIMISRLKAPPKSF
jgi:ferrochelatase